MPHECGKRRLWNGGSWSAPHLQDVHQKASTSTRLPRCLSSALPKPWCVQASFLPGKVHEASRARVPMWAAAPSACHFSHCWTQQPPHLLKHFSTNGIDFMLSALHENKSEICSPDDNVASLSSPLYTRRPIFCCAGTHEHSSKSCTRSFPCRFASPHRAVALWSVLRGQDTHVRDLESDLNACIFSGPRNCGGALNPTRGRTTDLRERSHHKRNGLRCSSLLPACLC